jgi:hypothetical protein
VSPAGGVDDVRAITEVIYRYCRAIDRLDPELAGTIWHSDGTADYGTSFQGTGSEFLDHVWRTHAPWLGHSHQIANVLVEVDGDRAGSEAYVTAAVWMEAANEQIAYTVSKGRYVDRWSHRDGAWAIDHRQWVEDFTVTSLVSGRAKVTAARRDRTDPSYGVLRARG